MAEYYYRAIQDDPAFASAHFKLGHILERRGNIPAAESRYRQALALRPELIPANIGLARIHYLNRSDFLAVDLLEQVLEWEPRNSEARIYLARIHQSNSKLDKALDTLKPGLAFHKENLFFRLEIGKLNYATGNPDEALIDYRYIIENQIDSIDPVSQKEAQSLKSEAFSSIAQLHLDNSDSIQAEEYLQKAIETMPYNFPALLKSALIAFNQDDRSHALNRLKQIASLPEEIRPPLQSITKANRSTNWTSLVNEAHK